MSALPDPTPCIRCETALPPGDGPCPTCGASRVPPGAQVLDGRWVLERVLGKGGMGTVWLAHDVDLDRKVAVKLLSPALAADAELLARFEREARMMGRLDHPNLVPVYGVGRRKGTPYIVMKLLEGKTLHDTLAERGALPAPEVLGLVRQLCAGLEFMHQRGVVHRDLKPANLFLGVDGHLTVLDLGVAREAHSTMTAAGAMMGTPQYMPPEQVVGKRVDHRADLYSLAALTWELLTNRPVFEGESDHSVMKAHLGKPPPDAAQLVGASKELAAVLTRGLSKKPEERFQAAREFLGALEQALAVGPAPAEAVPTTTVPTMVSPVAALAAPEPPERPPPPVPSMPPFSTGVVPRGLATRRERGPTVQEDAATDAVTEDHLALNGPPPTLDKTKEMAPLLPTSTLELEAEPEDERTASDTGPSPEALVEKERATKPESPAFAAQDPGAAGALARRAKARAKPGDAFESGGLLDPVPDAKTEERPPLVTGWFFSVGGKTHHVSTVGLALGALAALGFVVLAGLLALLLR